MTSTGWRSIFSYALLPALGLVSGPILARALDTEGRGHFAAVVQPITVAAAFASLGFPTAITYFVANGKAAANTYRRALTVAALPMLTTYSIMLIYARDVAKTQDISWSLIAICWLAIPTQAVIQMRRGVWQGQGNWRRLDYERAIYSVSRFVAIVFIALLGVTSSIPYIFVSLTCIALGASILWYPRPALTLLPDPAPLVARSQIAKYGLTSSIGTIALVANSRLDQVLMPATSTATQLGLYSVAVTIAEVPLILGTLASRDALQLAGNGSSAAEIFRAVKLYLVITVASSVGAICCAPTFVPLLFGRSFGEASSSVIILAAGSSFAAFAYTVSAIMFGRGRPVRGSAIPLIGALVTVVGFVTLWGNVTSFQAATIAFFSQIACAVYAATELVRDTRRSPSSDSEIKLHQRDS